MQRNTFVVPARPGDGLTFEVQQLGKEGLGGGLEAEALSGCEVVGGSAGIKGIGGRQVGFPGQRAPHAPDGVFDAALCQGLWVSQKKVCMPGWAAR
jgi:hypothetical protein